MKKHVPRASLGVCYPAAVEILKNNTLKYLGASALFEKCFLKAPAGSEGVREGREGRLAGHRQLARPRGPLGDGAETLHGGLSCMFTGPLVLTAGPSGPPWAR